MKSIKCLKEIVRHNYLEIMQLAVAHWRLSLSSNCALPGAHKKNPNFFKLGFCALLL